MIKNLKSTPAVYIIFIITNVLILYFAFSQVTKISSLNRYWEDIAVSSLETATRLLEAERKLGYVGFIHHFKNYVIRRDEIYYEKALISYFQAKESIKTLKEVSINDDEIAAITSIEKTLDEYYRKLAFIHDTEKNISIEQLDDLVKVDDSEAEKALILLRNEILPKLKEQQLEADLLIKTLDDKTLLFAAILIPVVLLGNIITVRVIRDLTATSKELSAIFDASPDAILYIDEDGRIIRANRSAEKLFGYSLSEIQMLDLEDLIVENLRDNHKILRKAFNQREQSRDMLERDVKIEGLRKDGTLVQIQVGISSKKIDHIMRTVCVVKDISEHKKLEEAALKDHLTKIYNRRSFDDILNKEIQRNHRDDKTLTLLLIDIDNFKLLNDTYGHKAGDTALKQVAIFLREHTRGYDHLVRWGGDEFAILCPDLSAIDSLNYAERIRASFETDTLFQEYKLSLSIGVASLNQQNKIFVGDLLEATDKAVYNAKKKGRNRVAHFDYI